MRLKQMRYLPSSVNCLTMTSSKPVTASTCARGGGRGRGRGRGASSGQGVMGERGGGRGRGERGRSRTAGGARGVGGRREAGRRFFAADEAPRRNRGRGRTVWLGKTLSHAARARWTCAPRGAGKRSLSRSFSKRLNVGGWTLIPRAGGRPRVPTSMCDVATDEPRREMRPRDSRASAPRSRGRDGSEIRAERTTCKQWRNVARVQRTNAPGGSRGRWKALRVLHRSPQRARGARRPRPPRALEPRRSRPAARGLGASRAIGAAPPPSPRGWTRSAR